MRFGTRVGIAVVLAVGVVLPPSADAVLSKAQYVCREMAAKAAIKALSAELRLRQRCIEASLANTGSCTAPDPDLLHKVHAKLLVALDKRCHFDGNAPANLAAMGFPGPCADADPGDGFTVDDLHACITESHTRGLTGMCSGGTNLGESCSTLADCSDGGPGTVCRGLLTLQYAGDVLGPLTGSALRCQKQIVKSTGKYLFTILRSVQQCRNDLMNCRMKAAGELVCKLSGFPASACAFNDPRAVKAILKSEEQLRDGVHTKCTEADAGLIGICEPDQPTIDDGIVCLLHAVRDLADNPDVGAPFDFLDFVYAAPPVCGDRRVNQPSEECDGSDDAACLGQCGSASGLFPCLCQNVPRQRLVEHAGGDRDDVFGHDGATTEGSGYLVDLRDCDGPGGPDTVCTVGPSCSLPPHAPCSPAPAAPASLDTGDEICASLAQGVCRTTAAGATGPHCEIDVQRRCANDAACPTTGDRCVTTLHGPPVPVASGGIGVCVVNAFAEDVVGTVDVASGEGSVRLRERVHVHVGGSLAQPCPVCGGFCSGPGSFAGPGARTLCSVDGDCAAGDQCVTDALCSYGPRADHPCRPNAPFGGPTASFGNPSIDCPPPPATISGTGLDVVQEPRTTDHVTFLPTHACMDPSFAGDACRGGSNAGRPCAADAECPGGTCAPQCFCAGADRPNDCAPACVGGSADAAPCSGDGDCSGGFCHAADCRPDPLDTDSIQEGHCTTEPDRQCFVNAGIERTGAAGVVGRVTTAVGCIPGTTEPWVVGLPAPFASTQPETSVVVGF